MSRSVDRYENVISAERYVRPTGLAPKVRRVFRKICRFLFCGCYENRVRVLSNDIRLKALNFYARVEYFQNCWSFRDVYMMFQLFVNVFNDCPKESFQKSNNKKLMNITTARK